VAKERRSPAYCSRECYWRNWGKAMREVRSCIGCGKSFKTWKSCTQRGFYCGRDCYLDHQAPKHWIEYDGHKFRSKWEALYAEWLDLQSIQWDYEPKTYRMSNGRRYTPDFLVKFPSGLRVVELHRVRQAAPGDGRKLATLRLAVVEIPGFMLVDDREMNDVRRELRHMRRAIRMASRRAA
jgi:hypothetical protein